jgi:hypothetical protein
MPVAVKAFACEFRCGHKVMVSAKAISRHEKNCFSNPGVKACRTCKHFAKDYADNGNGADDIYRYCDLEKLSKGQFAKRDCEFHELRCK